MQWIHIFVKDLKVTARDKLAWIMMIILPLVVSIVAGFALSGMFSANIPTLKLAYSYSGESKNIEPFLHGLETMDAIELIAVSSKKDGLALIEKSSITGLVVIPNDFNVAQPGAKFTLDFYYDIASQSSADVLKGMVQGVVKTLNDSLVSIDLLVRQAEQYGAVAKDVAPQIASTVEESFHKNIRISISEKGVGGEEINRSFYQVIPGFAVMFLLFSILGGASKLIEERNNKTLRRILISPTNKSDIILGKWFGMTIEGFCQASILFLAAKFIFKLSLGSNPLNLFAFLFLVAATTGAIGVFIASIVKSLKQANGLAMILFMFMSAIGGSWWPLEITPPFMQTMGKFTLNYWAIAGVKKLILFQQPITSLAFEIMILALICLIFLFLSFDKFKFE